MGSKLPIEFAEAIDRVRPGLGRLAGELLFFESIGSTNDVAMALAAEGDREGLVVFAAAQSAGRGRRGHTWFSPPASGLYVSVVLAPGRAANPSQAVALLTLAAGVALSEGIADATGLCPDIKWPNDLFIGRRKVAGILAEAVATTTVVLGYGINVAPMSYPPELFDRATALEVELGRVVDRAALFAATLAALSRRYDDLIAGRFDAILDAWRSRSPGCRGTRVSWQSGSGSRSGVTAGIDDRGALLVQTGDTIERIVAGELQWS